MRGPLCAPVTLWLADAGNQPVVPLSFTGEGFPLEWQTADSGPAENGRVEVAPSGRPVAYGPTPTDTSPMVTCTSLDTQGFWEFGTYVMTRNLVAMLGLPGRLVGRTLSFSNEGSVTLRLPRTQFH